MQERIRYEHQTKSRITKSAWFLVNTSTKRNKRKHQPASEIYRLKQIDQKSVGVAPPKWRIIKELVWENLTIHNAYNANGKYYTKQGRIKQQSRIRNC